MATLNLGRIKPVFKGAWNSGAFVIDDIVTHGNETFICIQAGTNKATTDAAYWTKLAAKGTDGTDVGTTITTQGDILYRDGSGLQRLGAGTSGQFLKTLGTGANPAWATVTTKIIGATRFYNSTRATLPNQANHVWWSVSHTKTSSTSFLFVQGLAPGQGSMSDQMGEYVEYNSVKNYYGIRHMLYGDGVNTTWMNYHANNLAAGTYDLKLGWSVQNGTAQRWGAIVNPNSSDDGRDHQTGSEMIVWEIEN